MKKFMLLLVMFWTTLSIVFSQVLDRWTPLDDLKDFITFIIDPVDNNIIYATHSYGICKSNDGGLSWTNIEMFTSDYASSIVLNPTYRDTLYLGVEAIGTGGRGVYRSANQVTPGPRFIVRKVFPALLLILKIHISYMPGQTLITIPVLQ